MKKIRLILLALVICIGFPATGWAGSIAGDTVTWHFACQTFRG
jgi:hypothetical protein